MKIALTIVAASLLLSGSTLRADTQSERRVVRILRHGGTMLALTETGGIYRASINDGVWRKMKTPADMPKGGTLVQQSDSSPLLLYYVADSGDANARDARKGAIYVSADSGGTWKLASRGTGDYLDLFLHPDGSLYAFECVEAAPDWPEGDAVVGDLFRSAQLPRQRARLIVSHDLGKTWKVISEHFPRNYACSGIFQDPDHPSQVCFLGEIDDMSTKAYDPMVFQAAGKSGPWKITRADQWHDRTILKQYERLVFFDHISNGDQDYYGGDFPATLDNVQMYPFLQFYGYANIPAVRVEAKRSFTFRADGPKLIPVAITAGDATPQFAVRMLDSEDQSVFWGARVWHKEKEAGDSINPLSDWRNSPDAKIRGRFLFEPGVRTVAVDGARPYQRVIDLAKLDDFSKPGDYEVQLTHDDATVVNWGGNCQSGVIEVTITR